MLNENAFMTLVYQHILNEDNFNTINQSNAKL